MLRLATLVVHCASLVLCLTLIVAKRHVRHHNIRRCTGCLLKGMYWDEINIHYEIFVISDRTSYGG